MQRWKPDTCKCVILEDVVNGSPVYNSHEFVCDEHQGLTQEKLAIIPHEHNTRKNKIDGLFRDNLKSLLTDTTEDGSIVYKNGISFNWSYSGIGENRIITVTISGISLTNPQKNTIQNLCNTQFGAGKVVVG